jgi:hypothetical protein
MNADDAARLVNLLVATWPGGPKAYVWTQALEALDAPAANRAYARLRDTAKSITVAGFREVYDTASRPAPGGRRYEPTAGCVHCGGTGFEPGEPIYETVLGEPHEYTTLQPCRCTRPAPPRPPQPSLLDAT